MMLSRYLTTGLATIATLAALWGAVSHYRASALSKDLVAARQAAVEAHAQAASARQAVVAMEAHLDTLRQQAAEAEQLRAEIEDRADETLAPDWLADLPRRLREAAERAAADPRRPAGAGATARP